MIYKITDTIVVDSCGIRILNKNGKPVNCRYTDLKPLEDDDIEKARKYVTLLSESKTINKNVSSYSLKHRAEDYFKYMGNLKQLKGYDYYVSNGSLIFAMIEAGFNFCYFNQPDYFTMIATKKKQDLGYDTSLNVSFNVYIKQLKQYEKLHKIKY